MTLNNFKKITVLTFFAIAAAGLFSSFTPLTNEYAKKWKHLGTKKVNFGLDKDVIKVSSSKGVFTKLKLGVSSGKLNMHRMIVVYGNGDRQEMNIKHNFSKGVSRTIDLNGNKRVINKVIFWYDTKNRSRRKATMHLYGRR